MSLKPPILLFPRIFTEEPAHDFETTYSTIILGGAYITQTKLGARPFQKSRPRNCASDVERSPHLRSVNC